MRGGLIYSSKKPAMEIISLNCNKLKIITECISYNNNIMGGGGLLERGAYFIFSLKRGAYLRGGGLNKRLQYTISRLNRGTMPCFYWF